MTKLVLDDTWKTLEVIPKEEKYGEITWEELDEAQDFAESINWLVETGEIVLREDDDGTVRAYPK